MKKDLEVLLDRLQQEVILAQDSHTQYNEFTFIQSKESFERMWKMRDLVSELKNLIEGLDD